LQLLHGFLSCDVFLLINFDTNENPGNP